MCRPLVFVFSFLMIASWQPASAASNHVVELAKPTKASLEIIGKKPPKRFIQLDLGDLRTRSALLPDGERDLKARIRLRNRRALEQQRVKTKRKKKKKKKSAKADDGEPETGDEESKEGEAKSEKAEKKVAKTTKKKRKKKKKKKGKKRSGGSGSRPALNANPTKAVKIE